MSLDNLSDVIKMVLAVIEPWVVWMKNGSRLIVIVLKTAVAAYLIGCVGLSWLQQLRQKLERFGRMQPKEHRNDQTDSETRRPIRVIRRYGGAPAGAFCSRGSWDMAWK
jgi:uncharacterized membrane protein YqaE (UPF0057 family)